MVLTVVFRNDSPMIVCNDTPTYRSVQVELTPEQLEKIAPRKTGFSDGKLDYESISRCFLEPEE